MDLNKLLKMKKLENLNSLIAEAVRNRHNPKVVEISLSKTTDGDVYYCQKGEKRSAERIKN